MCPTSVLTPLLFRCCDVNAKFPWKCYLARKQSTDTRQITFFFKQIKTVHEAPRCSARFLATERIPGVGEQDAVYQPINQTEPLSRSIVCTCLFALQWITFQVNLWGQNFSQHHWQKVKQKIEVIFSQLFQQCINNLYSKDGQSTCVFKLLLCFLINWVPFSTLTELPSETWFWDCFTAVVGFSSAHSWTLENHSFKWLLIIAWNPNLPKLPAYVSANNYSSQLNPVIDEGWIQHNPLVPSSGQMRFLLKDSQYNIDVELSITTKVTERN